MRPFAFAFAMILGLLMASVAVQAETLACPSLAAAAQVADCPTDAQLRMSYLGYCGDDRRMYEKDSMTCASIEEYKKLKNTALWESRDGKFQAYVDCALKPEQVKAAKVYRVQVQTSGKISRVMCDYDHEIVFVHRNRAACTIAGDGKCGPDPTACKAECE